MRILLVALFLLMGCDFLTAQKIDNMASFRAIKSENYFRFNYDNDYFTATDRNYTQGYSFEFVAPIFKKNPINYLFINANKSELTHGLSLEHNGYTPKHLNREIIQYGDRPYAAVIMLKNFAIAVDTLRKARFVSALSVGVIGPAAFGKEMQVGIHQATKNVIPLGWHNQIKNDLALNYELGYEKQLLRYRDFFALHSNSNLKLGTFVSNASIGFNTVIGKINSPFTTVKNNNKFELYVYTQPIITVVGYDATMQGGLLNDKSPYTISDSKIERFTTQFNYGIVLQTRKMYFEYSRVILSREFNAGMQAEWGGVKLGVKF